MASALEFAPKSIFRITLNSRAFVVLLLIPIFLEADVFSVNIFGVRIHAVMISEIILLGLAVVLCAQRFSIKVKTPPLLNLLFIYLAVNVLSLMNAPSLKRGITILILLFSLVILYTLVVKMLTSVSVFDYAYTFLLIVGFVEITFGLYQVAAGMVQHYFGIALWVGHAGLAHAANIQSPWGRPYGTFVEPDWYGAICIVYVILFGSLLVENKGWRQRWFGYMGLIASAAGILFGFVRASWIGLIIGMIVFALVCWKAHVRIPLKVRIYLSFFAGIAVLFSAVFVTYGALGQVMGNRFSTINSDPRIATMIYSTSIFLANPIIGNGPGCFKELGIGNISDLQRKLEGNNFKDEDSNNYDPSIVTTVLSDTGIIGAISFLLLIIAWWRHSIRFLKHMPQYWRVRCIGLFSAVCGLLFSYILTTGFWIPFTWVFLGFNVAAVELGRQAIEQAGDFASMEARSTSGKTT